MVKNKKNVLLIGPHNPIQIRTGQYLSPPLGLYRISSYLEQKGLANVDVVDPTLDYQNTLHQIKEKPYDLIGHSLLHPTLEEDLRLAWKTNKISPNSLQIAGGQGASFNSEDILMKTPIKAIVRGFGEYPLEEILKNYPKIDNVKGLYINQEKEVISTGLRERMTLEEFRGISLETDFSKIPYQKYWKFMGEAYDGKYIKAMKNKGTVKTIRLMVSSHCPFKCSHCSATNFFNDGTNKNQKLLFLEPKEIISMMNQAKKAHSDVESFYFVDDNFLLLGKEKIFEFCERTNELDKKYNLMFLGRVDDIDRDILKKMKKANFNRIFYGVETFSNRLAKDLKKKKVGRDDYNSLAKKALSETIDVGINAQISLMMFIPTSKQEDLETTIESSLDFIERGAGITLFPYIEAYSGADIVNKGHDMSYKEFEIEGKSFRFTHLVLPDDKDIRILAEKSLVLKEELNKEEIFAKFKGNIPQPVDSLNLFRAIYNLLGKSTSKIEKILGEY